MNLQWHASLEASWAHAAAAVSSGIPLNHAALSGALHPLVADIGTMLATFKVQPAWFYDHLVPLAHGEDNLKSLAELALRKSKGSEAAQALGSRLGHELVDLQQRFHQVFPRAGAELPVRLPLLREQWESRGPGLLYALADLTEPGLLCENATVYLVYPSCGGGGRAHPWYNSVHLEAVLTNPHSSLPEMVRLGWLLAQLNFDLPRYHDDIGVPLAVSQLAMVPLILAAAQRVDWARADEATIRLAVQSWLPQQVSQISTLLDWWQVFQGMQADWATGARSLVKMIGR